MVVLFLLIVSICIGIMLRRFRGLRRIERTSTWTVWMLIFVFGISLGSNDEIVNDFAGFGLTALIVAFAGVAGSVLVAWGIGNYIDKSRGK